MEFESLLSDDDLGMAADGDHGRAEEVTDDALWSWLDGGRTPGESAETVEEAEGVLDWLTSIGSGAATGAATGATAGPWGALIGALVGGGLGALQAAGQSQHPGTSPPGPPPATPPPPAPAPSPATPSVPPGSVPGSSDVLRQIAQLLPLLTQLVTQLHSPGQPARQQETADERTGQQRTQPSQDDNDDQLPASPAGDATRQDEPSAPDHAPVTSEPPDSTTEPVGPIARAQTTGQDVDDVREELLGPPTEDTGDTGDGDAGPPFWKTLQALGVPSVVAWGPATAEEITLLPPEWRWG